MSFSQSCPPSIYLFIVPSAPKHKFLNCGFIPTIALRFVEFILLFDWVKPRLSSRSKQLLEVHFQCELLSFLFSTKLPSSTDPASLCLTTQQALSLLFFSPLCWLSAHLDLLTFHSETHVQLLFFFFSVWKVIFDSGSCNNVVLINKSGVTSAGPMNYTPTQRSFCIWTFQIALQFWIKVMP